MRVSCAIAFLSSGSWILDTSSASSLLLRSFPSGCENEILHPRPILRSLRRSDRTLCPSQIPACSGLYRSPLKNGLHKSFPFAIITMLSKSYRSADNPERYRSGHNEAVLKTVCPQGRMGSNPILSAQSAGILKERTRRSRTLFGFFLFLSAGAALPLPGRCS